MHRSPERFARVEGLEQRLLMAANIAGMHLVQAAAGRFDGQVVYLDFDGASDVVYNGRYVTTAKFDVPAFDTGGGENQYVGAVLTKLNRTFAGTGVTFTTTQPATGTFSSVYVGGDNDVLEEYGEFMGVAEKLDAGNADRDDEAFIFATRLRRDHPQTDPYKQVLADTVQRTVAHLLGYANNDGDAIDEPLALGGRRRVLRDVPLYRWWYGCGPTAAGMVMGYWDQHGYGNLARGENGIEFTQAAKDMIAGPDHILAGKENKPKNGGFFFGNGDYRNSPSLPNHENNPTSLADFIRTSNGFSDIGWTKVGMERYAGWRGHGGFKATQYDRAKFGFERVMAEVDAGRPLLAIVDIDADGIWDHATAIAGYDSSARTVAMVEYDKDHAVMKWFKYAPPRPGITYGIEFVDTVVPPNHPQVRPNVESAVPGPTPVVSIKAVRNKAIEGGQTGVFRITRTGNTDEPLTVRLKVTGTAKAGTDYKSFSRVITFAAGKSSVTIQVTAKADTATEGNESLTITLERSDKWLVKGGFRWCKLLIGDKPRG